MVGQRATDSKDQVRSSLQGELLECVCDQLCYFSFLQHPEFAMDGSKGFPNDIALIRLSQSADISKDNIQPISLPSSTDESFYEDKKCIISGWGLESETHSPRSIGPVFIILTLFRG